jgi:hypothetical protein
MSMLANLFFLCALLPFLSPLPAPSDVQLPAFVVASLIVRSTRQGRFTFNWVEGVFLSVAIWSFCFVLPGSPSRFASGSGSSSPSRSITWSRNAPCSFHHVS